MWKFGILLLSLTLTLVSGQEQYLREVTNPSGPSQIVLRGGFLGNSATPDEVQVVDQPEQQQQEAPQQALALQSPEQPIPQDGNNPFTNGDNGFGLRLSQPAPAPQPVQHQQQQQPQPHTVSQQPQQQVSQQPQTVLQHQPLTLPQLPPGQQYVDLYGRPIFFTNAPVAPAPQVLANPQPQPQPQQQAAPSPQAPAVPQQALVDQYGRKLGNLQPTLLQPATVPVVQQQQLLQPAGVPVVQHQQILQPGAVPVVQHHHVVQPAAVHLQQQILQPVQQVGLAHEVIQPVIQQHATLLHKAPPPLTLQTYAVPTFRKVGNLNIPYAQKITVLNKLKEGVVFPPTVPAPAVVKDKTRTVFSPVKVAAPAAEVHPVVHQEVHAAPGQLLLHHEQQQVVVQQPLHLEHHPQQLVQVAQPAHVVHHAQPQQLVEVAHHPVAVAHHPVAVAHLPVAVAHPPVQVVHHQPVLLKKKVIEKHIIPDYTLIHQPVLDKVLFQKHIFNVKHGSEPLIYQDLCTVYPYQKNLRACVLKKAVLPELHHPDIRTINVEEVAPQTDQTIIAGGSSIVSQAPATTAQPASTAPAAAPTVIIMQMLPKNIEDTINKVKKQAMESAMAAATENRQPEPAESREPNSSSNSNRKRREKRKKSSSRNSGEDDEGFKLV